MNALREVGDGLFAYVQREGTGGWGWSNAGLVVDGDQTLLVDTLFDLELTDEMLRAMRDAVPAARRIGSLVNTHVNGDHCYGNELVGGPGSSPRSGRPPRCARPRRAARGPEGERGAARRDRRVPPRDLRLRAEARERFERGMDALTAARDLPDDHRWRSWGERERLAVNVATLFRSWAGEAGPPDPLEPFGLMAAFARGPR